jgi:hypothetical protein
MRTAERYKNRPLGLSPRQCGYVLNLAQGMSRRGAALAAGYSERVADNVGHDVEGKRRGRFSMIRRFVELLRANRPELLGEEGKRGDSGDPSPLALAEGLIEALSMPTSLLCQVSNCIETKARANGISFAAARDQLRVQMQTHPPPDRKWALWLLDGDYGHGPAYRNEAKHERDGNCRPGRRARAVRKNYGPPAARTTGGPGGEKRESSTRL